MSWGSQALEVEVGPLRLRGVLSRPAKHCVAGVVLVHGSGPQDRDLSVGPNKPFADLSAGLCARGIATLRYPKRTLVRRGAALIGEDFTVQHEIIDDAHAAIELLARMIDRARVFALGHSLGGSVMPRIMQGAPALCGAVVMGGSTLPVLDSIERQLSYLRPMDGSARARFMHVKLCGQLARARRLGTGRRVARAHLPFGLPAAYWLDLAAHRPAEQLAREPRPVLVLHAERDYQVTADDLAGWQAALASKANATIIRYPELNHLFMAGEGNSTPSEYLRPGTLSPRLIDDIAAWVERHTTGGATARAGDRAGYSQG